MTVLVVGGGITGLATALDLGRAGIPTVLAEASDRLGGKVATERIGPFLVELGPDSFLATRPAAVTFARELGLGEELIGVVEPRTVYIRRDGRLVPMPAGLGLVLPTRVGPFVGTPLFSLAEKARMSLDLVLPRVASPDDESVGRFLRRRLGRPLVDRLAGPLVGGIYGTSIDDLSLDAVVPQLRAAEREHRSLLLAGLADGRRMRTAQKAARTAPSPPSTPLGIFASLRGGLGELVVTAVRAVEATGSVEIRLGLAVRSLTPVGAGFVAGLSDGTSLRVDGVVVATTGPAAACLVEPFAPDAAGAVAAIPHGSSSVVTLAWRRDRIPPIPIGHGVLVPASEGLPISACTISSQKWPGRAPDDTVLVRAFLPDEPVAGRTETELAALARSALAATLGIGTEPEFVRVSSYPATMPRYTVGHLARVAQAEAALERWPAVVLAGCPYHGVGLPDCIAGGRAAAARVIEHVATGIALSA